MTPSLDPKQHADELVTATGGARSDFPAQTGPTTIDGGELDDISGGIIDCTPPFPPQRPDSLPRPDGLPFPSPLPRPGTIPLGPFFPSQPKPDPV